MRMNGDNGEQTDSSEFYVRNSFVTTFQPGDDVVHKAYISVALPPANAGFGIPKIILSEQVLSEAELGEALDKAAELNARWLQAFAESNPDKVESLADLRNRGIEHPEAEADHKAAVELVKANLIKRGFEVRDAERAATK